MIGMAVLALVFALLTQELRRRNDFRNKAVAPVPLAQRPSELLGLGYLPAGTNIVAGLHVMTLTDEAAGRVLLRRPRPNLIESLLGTLDVVGLDLADVDHVVLGCELKDFSPKLTTVIVTRKPYDPAKVEQAVQRQPVSATTFRNGPLYRFTALPGIPKLWCADRRVLVWTSLTKEDLERIPEAPKGGPAGLTPAVREALTDRLGKQSVLWAAGDLAPAIELADLLQHLGLLARDQARLIGLVRTFAAGITIRDEADLALLGEFYTGDRSATPELRRYLEGIDIKGARSVKVATPPADAKGAEAQWVSWQVHAEAEVLREAIGKLRLGPRLEKAQTP
jgi:hypothetical protein